MSQPENQTKSSAQPWRRPLGIVAIAAFLLLFFAVQDEGSVDVFGVSMPISVFGLLNYIIGVVAMIGFRK